ncbi:uncharacterized protein L3040_009042 [Drepanopeziza brunnea f. sp. 'multigermtubi']|uniref:uncharacterized protein n=1 Tax=Drepanopeziza brunnea f. sp. 'multigermtubi' TaxID=698441 RepID=UPI0023A4D01B|nr:hypothetical protein L3040_009042 [Drepanopeziza brunnea f. sp. 'multigermtubi']
MQTPGELLEQLSQLLFFSIQSHSEPPIHLLASTSSQSPFLLRSHSPAFIHSNPLRQNVRIHQELLYLYLLCGSRSTLLQLYYRWEEGPKLHERPA